MIKDRSLVKETNVFNILSISSVKTIMKSVYYKLIAEEHLVQLVEVREGKAWMASRRGNNWTTLERQQDLGGEGIDEKAS